MPVCLKKWQADLSKTTSMSLQDVEDSRLRTQDSGPKKEKKGDVLMSTF
jgi:hypothetical protein